jgi:iron(III) transport system permease protein
MVLVSNIGLISENYTSIVLSQVWNTAVIVAVVVVITTVLGVVTAWVFALYDFPFKKWLEICLIMGMVFPSYVLAFFYSETFNVFGQTALIGTLVVATLPYVFMITTMSLRSQSQQLVESALMLGKGQLWTKFKIILPLLRPAIVLSMLLVAGDTFSEFGATYFYGVDTVITGIYEIWFGLYELDTGIRFAAWVFLTTVAIYYIINTLKGNSISFQPELANGIGGQSLRSEQLGKTAGILVTVLVMFLVTITFFIPIAVLGDWVIKGYAETDLLKVVAVTFNSSVLATGIAISVITISTIVLYLFKRNYGVISMWANGLYSTPGIILAITAIYIVNMVSSDLVPYLFVYILILKYFAMGVDSIGVGIQKINRQYYYSAKTLGKDSKWYVWNIQIPLSIRAYLIAGILIWIDVIRELAIGLTIRPQWLDLLSVEIFRFMDIELLYMSGPWILAMVLITFIPIYWINVVMKMKD